jgi:hypothetical protein
MNFTPWETINEAINAGAKFWSVYDQSGKRLIFELQQETAPEDSADKLRAILNREAGEFVQVKLSFQSTKEKGNGGNTRGFTYFYKLPNPGGSFSSQPQFNSSIGGISLSDYVNVIEQKNAAEREKLKMELQKEAAPSFAERIATPENVSKFFEIAGALVNSLNKKNSQPPLLTGPAQFDAETVEAVNTLLSFEDGKAALVNIAAAGPLVWQMIHAGLKENKLLP